MAPEFWWDGTELDSRFIDAMSVPQGMVLEMEEEIGRYAGGLDLTEAGDRQRYKAAMWVLDHKLAPRVKEQPFFHVSLLCCIPHTHGPSRQRTQSRLT